MFGLFERLNSEQLLNSERTEYKKLENARLAFCEMSHEDDGLR